jgi:NTE family protein
MSSPEMTKTAVALSGGGAYGAYEVGVLKSLVNGRSRAVNFVPLQPAILTGTSVGSFNAAALTMVPRSAIEGVTRLEQIWLHDIADRGGGGGNGVYRIRCNPEGYLECSTLTNPLEPLLRAVCDAAYFSGRSVAQVKDFLTSGGSLANRVLGLIDISALISVEPFDELLKRTIDPERIRASSIHLCVVATNWQSGEAKPFYNGNFTDAEGRDVVKASASFPGIFPATQIGDVTYVDGGVVMNTPISYALDAGATELHLVYMNAAVRGVPLRTNEGTIDVLDRAFATMLAAAINQDIAMAESINAGLESLDAAAAGRKTDPSDSKKLLRVAARITQRSHRDRPYRKITIHKHYPQRPLGGVLGLLNFSQEQIQDLIELGYQETRAHDCDRNQCVIPK